MIFYKVSSTIKFADDGERKYRRYVTVDEITKLKVKDKDVYI